MFREPHSSLSVVRCWRRAAQLASLVTLGVVLLIGARFASSGASARLFALVAYALGALVVGGASRDAVVPHVDERAHALAYVGVAAYALFDTAVSLAIGPVGAAARVRAACASVAGVAATVDAVGARARYRVALRGAGALALACATVAGGSALAGGHAPFVAAAARYAALTALMAWLATRTERRDDAPDYWYDAASPSDGDALVALVQRRTADAALCVFRAVWVLGAPWYAIVVLAPAVAYAAERAYTGDVSSTTTTPTVVVEPPPTTNHAVRAALASSVRRHLILPASASRVKR